MNKLSQKSAKRAVQCLFDTSKVVDEDLSSDDEDTPAPVLDFLETLAEKLHPKYKPFGLDELTEAIEELMLEWSNVTFGHELSKLGQHGYGNLINHTKSIATPQRQRLLKSTPLTGPVRVGPSSTRTATLVTSPMRSG